MRPASPGENPNYAIDSMQTIYAVALGDRLTKDPPTKAVILNDANPAEQVVDRFQKIIEIVSHGQ